MSQPCVGLCSWTVWNTSQKDYENNTISGALESRECLLPIDWQKSISPYAKQQLIPMPFVGCKRKSCKHWPLPSTFLICCVAVPGLSPSKIKVINANRLLIMMTRRYEEEEEDEIDDEYDEYLYEPIMTMKIIQMLRVINYSSARVKNCKLMWESYWATFRKVVL